MSKETKYMETANKCNNKHILYTYDLGDESQVHNREYKNIPTSGQCIEPSRVRWVILGPVYMEVGDPR